MGRHTPPRNATDLINNKNKPKPKPRNTNAGGVTDGAEVERSAAHLLRELDDVGPDHVMMTSWIARTIGSHAPIGISVWARMIADHTARAGWYWSSGEKRTQKAQLI